MKRYEWNLYNDLNSSYDYYIETTAHVPLRYHLNIRQCCRWCRQDTVTSLVTQKVLTYVYKDRISEFIKYILG